LFELIEKVQRAARQRLGTGVLNRLLRQAFEVNPPPAIRARRLKLFYAAQSKGKENQLAVPPEFVLFVNDPRLLSQTYRRYLESQIRDAQPFPGLPIILTLRPRATSATAASRLRKK
jgi:GTP-binding protein